MTRLARLIRELPEVRALLAAKQAEALADLDRWKLAMEEYERAATRLQHRLDCYYKG